MPRHARLNSAAQAAAAVGKGKICVHSQLGSLKCVTFNGNVVSLCLPFIYLEDVVAVWPLVSIRILKTKWSPRWLADCTALNVGCRGAASLAWRGRGRWGIRLPPGTAAHGLTCSPFLAGSHCCGGSNCMGAGRRVEASERERLPDDYATKGSNGVRGTSIGAWVLDALVAADLLPRASRGRPRGPLLYKGV